MPAMNTSTAAVLGSVLVATSLLSVAPADAATASSTTSAPTTSVPTSVFVRPALEITLPPIVPAPAPAPVKVVSVKRVAAPAPRPVVKASRSASRLDQPVISTPARSPRLAEALTIARQQIGDRYAYGANGPDAFDCSGLVQYALSQAGFGSVPRTAAGQAAISHRVDRASLQPGDLIFFNRGGSIYHVGFFVGWDAGHALILHAPHAGAPVQIEQVWTDNWFGGTLS